EIFLAFLAKWAITGGRRRVNGWRTCLSRAMLCELEAAQSQARRAGSSAAQQRKTKTTLKVRLHMRKPELAAAIAEKADLSKEQANRAVNASLEDITQALRRKDTVTLVGFGTFLQRHRGARTGKNPQTGEPVKIKASNTVAFKPGKGLKDSVN